MPNSCEINSFVTGIKNMTVKSALLCYDKLLNFNSITMSNAKLFVFSAIELKDTVEKKYF